MSIASVVTRGFSTGTSQSSIALVVTAGFIIGEAAGVWAVQADVVTSWTVQPGG